MIKRCSKCKIEKSLEDFHKDATRKDGKCFSCKSCCRKNANQRYRDKNPVSYNHPLVNPKLKQCSKCRKVLERKHFHKWNRAKDGKQSSCKRCYSKTAKKYNSRPEIKKHKKQYSDKYSKQYLSRPETKEHRRQYENNRLRTNVQYKLTCKLRNRLYGALKGHWKTGSAVRNLGCTVLQLKMYLENQFYSNPETGEMMTWENHGKYGWHIDHVIPLSLFDLTDRMEFLEACNWLNLQPLWAKDNLSKKGNI